MPKRILQGVAVRDARDKTVIVRVERRVMHPVYKKFIMRSKKYAAHDEQNLIKVGQTVRIEESRADLQAQALGGAGPMARRRQRPVRRRRRGKPAAKKPAKPRAPRKKAAQAAAGAEG